MCAVLSCVRCSRVQDASGQHAGAASGAHVLHSGAGEEGPGRRQTCFAFARGSCMYGASCRYAHDATGGDEQGPSQRQRLDSDGHVGQQRPPQWHMQQRGWQAPQQRGRMQPRRMQQMVRPPMWQSHSQAPDYARPGLPSVWPVPPTPQYAPAPGPWRRPGPPRGAVGVSCRDFAAGRCTRGASCRFMHAVAP